MPLDAVKLVFLLPADAKAALASGSVDTWSTWERYTSQVEVIDGGWQIVNGVGIAPGQGFQHAAIDSKHDQVGDFHTRLTIARRGANTHVNRYAEIWAKLMTVLASVRRSTQASTPRRATDRRRRDMDKWLWTYVSTTIWPIAVLLCASLLPSHEGIWCWIDDDPRHNIEDDDRAFYVAMITAAHV